MKPFKETPTKTIDFFAEIFRGDAISYKAAHLLAINTVPIYEVIAAI